MISVHGLNFATLRTFKVCFHSSRGDTFVPEKLLIRTLHHKLSCGMKRKWEPLPVSFGFGPAHGGPFALVPCDFPTAGDHGRDWHEDDGNLSRRFSNWCDLEKDPHLCVCKEMVRGTETLHRPFLFRHFTVQKIQPCFHLYFRKAFLLGMNTENTKSELAN